MNTSTPAAAILYLVPFSFTLFVLIIVPLYPTYIFNVLQITVFPPSFSPSSSWQGSPVPTPALAPEPVPGVVDSGTEECNIFSGDWVYDPDAAYYTNNTCLAIDLGRDCLGNGRSNTEYLKWRWRPYGCDLPRFDPKAFLEMVRGKSLGFVGDSLSRNQMESLVCLLSSVDYPIDISNSTDVDFKRVFYVKYNFTITVMWSHFLVRTITPPNHDLDGIWKMYLDEPDGSWYPDIAKFDYVVISDGNWFMKRTMYYEKGKLVGCSKCGIEGVKDLTMYYGNRKAFRTALAALNNLKEFKGMVFLRTISPDHFQNGNWDTGGDCPKTMPFSRNQIDLYESGVLLYQGQLEEFIQAEKVGRISKGLKYGLIDITQAMVLRPDGHPNKYGHQRHPYPEFRNDCVHWCLPGPIELWNEFMYQLMIQLA